jgi:hypothetical protein
VRVKDLASGAFLPRRRVNASLSTTFTGLARGGEYRVYVTATNKAGIGKPIWARAALPPALLDAKPGAPERFRAAAVDEASARVTWEPPSGNPRVDAYRLAVRQTNATGWPMDAGLKRDMELPGDKRSAVVLGLEPGAYYAFIILVRPAAPRGVVRGHAEGEGEAPNGAGSARRGLREAPRVSRLLRGLLIAAALTPAAHPRPQNNPAPRQSSSTKYGDSKPNFAFRAMPARGQRAPGPPTGLRAAGAGDGVAVLTWAAPGQQPVDLYMINITQVTAGV